MGWAVRRKYKTFMKTKTIIMDLLVAIILVSCSQAVAVAPTEAIVPTSTSKPVPPTPAITLTPIPATEVDGQEIPDPHFSNPELFDLEKKNAPITQFIHALNLAGIDAGTQDVNGGLTYQTEKTKNGDMAVLLLTTDLSITLYDEGNIPLFIYSEDSKTGEYVWGAAYLKDIADLHDILVWAGINAAEEMDLNDQIERFTDNFNMATESWSSVDVPADVMDRDTEYRLSRISNENLQELMWFHLGDVQLGDRTFASKDKAVAYVNSEIDKIVQKHGDKMKIVNIFNEVNPFTKTV